MFALCVSEITPDFDDAARLRLIAAVQRSSIESMSLEPRLCVLDVGCGRGSGTLVLAAAVGVAGVVHGVDYDAMMIAEARQRALLEGVDARVFYHQANAIALPWPDGYFNASRSDCVLQHMLEPVRAFDELLRVTRTGGRVAVIDGDWATLDIDPMTRMLRHDCPTFRPRSDRRTLSLVNACVDCSHATDCETSRWTSAPFLTRCGRGMVVATKSHIDG